MAEAEPIVEPNAETEETTEAETTETTETKAETKTETKPETTDDWRAGIEDGKLKEFANRFTSPADAVKAGFEFRQKLSNAVVLPPKDATEEQVAEFRKKIGVPESVGDYEITAPENVPEDFTPDSETVQSFVEAAHAAGATQEVTQAAVDWFYGYLNEGVEAKQSAVKIARDQAEDKLRKEWPGDEYDRNIEIAHRAAVAFGGQDLQRFMENTVVDGLKLGHHPQMFRVFASVGRKMGEDSIAMGMTDSEKLTAEQQMDDLTKRAADARSDGRIDESDRLYAEREVLSNKLYGTEPVVGTESRTL